MHKNNLTSLAIPTGRNLAYRTLAITRKLLLPLALAVFLLLDMLLLLLVHLLRTALFVWMFALAMITSLYIGDGKDVRSALSLPTARGLKVWKLLTAPIERLAIGALRAKVEVRKADMLADANGFV